jgi:ADP-ribosylglycohydrolase
VNEEAYIKALRANIFAAGDTCSRAIFIGAVLGACVRKVPKTWEDKFDQETLEKIDYATKEILKPVG